MKWIYYVIGIVFIILITLPFFLSNNANESIIVTSNIVSAFASLITLMIALILFDKYGLRKRYKESQIEVVGNLYNEISSFSAMVSDKTHLYVFRPLQFLKELYEDTDIKLAFNLEYLERMGGIMAYQENIYLPKEIAQSLNYIAPYPLLHDLTKEQWEHDYCKVQVSNSTGDIKYDNFGRVGGEDLSLWDYYQSWMKVVSEIKKWYKENMGSDDLNIQ